MPLDSHKDDHQTYLFLLTAILFIAYLCIGMTLPVAPVFVAHDLGLNNLWAGATVGIAFLSTILTRGYAGKFVDNRGSKPAVRRGLILYMTGAVICLLAGFVSTIPTMALAILMSGRIILGLGESFVSVGINNWGIGLVGPQRSGLVMSLVGAAIYGAIGVGGPVGLSLYHMIGYANTMLAGFILPALGLFAIIKIPLVPPQPIRYRPSFLTIIGKIWLHGSIICLQGIGFATIGTFFTLYFTEKHWPGAGMGLGAFGAGFVLVRIFCGGLPDRMGGLPVATLSLIVEAVGQLLIWNSHSPAAALVGAFMTGLGCSMIFPGVGKEVVNLVTPPLRGTAIGGFSAFQDLAYGLTGPLAGFIADIAGYKEIFLAGSLASVLGFAVALFLRFRPVKPVQ
ncbi:MFS transporter [Acetobacteraceae bacterium ESL0709]|nr:MFS transporter [Acetobacteraceae bacterium ESL0697]MDF7677850.1 MFS transporter [Acetobacteraceae bacterium ESL0709]